MKTHRMSTGIALLILQHLHCHPITGYENPKMNTGIALLILQR